MSIIDWLHKAERNEPTSVPALQGLEGRVIAALRTVYETRSCRSISTIWDSSMHWLSTRLQAQCRSE